MVQNVDMPEVPPTVKGPALWVLERGDARVHLFGGRPPLPMAWSAPRVERVLEASEELWNETPPMGPETQQLALQHGFDPNAPLVDWLSSEDQHRLDAVAREAGLDLGVLEPMRPWLAAQLLTMASESRRGVDHESSPEAVLCAQARHRGIAIRHEFATPQAIADFFSHLPRQAEVELLRITLDDLQADPERDLQRAAAWLAGDLSLEEAHARAVHRQYPAFYEHLNVARNKAWIPRFGALLESGTRALIVVGIGHLTGPESLVEQALRAGFTAPRV